MVHNNISCKKLSCRDAQTRQLTADVVHTKQISTPSLNMHGIAFPSQAEFASAAVGDVLVVQETAGGSKKLVFVDPTTIGLTPS